MFLFKKNITCYIYFSYFLYLNCIHLLVHEGPARLYMQYAFCGTASLQVKIRRWICNKNIFLGEEDTFFAKIHGPLFDQQYSSFVWLLYQVARKKTHRTLDACSFEYIYSIDIIFHTCIAQSVLSNHRKFRFSNPTSFYDTVQDVP